MSNDLTREEWQDLLSNYTAHVLEGHWVVGSNESSGSQQFYVTIAHTNYDPSQGVVPLIGADASLFVGARILFGPGIVSAGGGQNFGFSTTVAEVTTSGGQTFVRITDAVPHALTAGDGITIYESVGAGASADTHLVHSYQVASGSRAFVASGDEVAYHQVDVYGTYRINGAVYAGSNWTQHAGSRVILGSGSKVVLNAWHD